ncbi:MAG: sugar phosphate isomerase/epimerase [Phaeodactylibacter sp.]|nr:sugar phosphate isomerase/epimerase [Phaeodactylibacter sp.]MCB9273007.1 sugar phosphate isomerase/epimerase [Lewinellaceae bacterium]
MKKTRRTFLRESGLMAAGLAVYGLSACGNSGQQSSAESDDTKMLDTSSELFFKISLAQWSLHKSLFDGKMDNLDFAIKAKKDFGIEAVEYVNQFFKDKAKDQAYLAEMKKRADDNGVRSVLIMIDGEGSLGSLDKKAREEAVYNHYKWLDAAKFLGCHSIRVNAAGEGKADDVAQAAAHSLTELGDYAEQLGMNVIVENHGGFSSNGQWLSFIMNAVNKSNVGTLPDFGNFCITRTQDGNCAESYDRYQGISELMPFAKGVSAKSYDFNEDGSETQMDYWRILKIVREAGYTGHIGIEYEGTRLSEEDGIRATKALLIREGAKLT